MASLSGLALALRDPEFYRDVARHSNQAGRGLVSQLGGPVDLVALAMRPFGYRVPEERIIGSGAWLGAQMGADHNALSYRLGSLIPTDVGDISKAASLGMAAAFKGAALKRPLESVDTFVGDLSNYSDKVYRETSIEEALGFIPGSRVSGTSKDLFVSNTPDMALGQGKNKGVLLEFDSKGIPGKLSTAKPMWQPSYEKGAAEFVARGGIPQESLSAVRVSKNIKASRGYIERLKRSLWELERRGWKKKEGDNYVEYSRE